VDLERRTAALAREAEVRARTEDALREAHADLEERVAQRTSELAHANQALRHEMAERSAAHHHLQQSEARLRALSRQLVAVQEAERDRLSRELHDRVGQNLTALGINLDILRIALDSGERPELLARLQDSIALLDATVEAIENVMSELRPPMLDEYGLLPALEWYGREFSQRTGVEVGVSATSHAERPAPDVEITLLRIVAEALNNVVKHAGATRVEIEIETSGEEYAMIVSDNGVGFDPDANPRPGRGIRTMRQRAQALGGALEIRAMPGNGTTIIARIPL
jgi:signal transduction histidine kinase